MKLNKVAKHTQPSLLAMLAAGTCIMALVTALLCAQAATSGGQPQPGENQGCPDPGTGTVCQVWDSTLCRYLNVIVEKCKWVFVSRNGTLKWVPQGSFKYSGLVVVRPESTCESGYAFFQLMTRQSVLTIEMEDTYISLPDGPCAWCIPTVEVRQGPEVPTETTETNERYDFVECAPGVPV
jgi:hypothetical protein